MRKFLFLWAAFYLMTSILKAEEVMDVLIQNAEVYDGVSLSAIKQDVAVKDGKIAKLGKLSGIKAKQIIDASGFVLSPGFIDAHTHSDFNPFVYPDLTNKISQGVTTEIVGNCGMSAAPVIGKHRPLLHSIWAREGVIIPEKINWESLEGYEKNLKKQKMLTNFGLLVGHGNLRSALMGNESRPATSKEIQNMKKLLNEAMDQGALGISFGLVYLPGIFAEKEELIELCSEVGNRGGVCAFHMRSEGEKLIESVQEVIDIGQKTKAKIQISHLKAGGRKNWKKMVEAFQLIEAAQKKGLQIHADVYPYTAGHAELGVMLPNDLYQSKDRLAILKSQAKRKELLESLVKYYKENGTRWDSVRIAYTPYTEFHPFMGKTLQEAADMAKQAPVEFLVRILADTSLETSAFYFSQSPKVMKSVAGKNYVFIGSDSISDGSDMPHPRAFGTFPEAIRKFSIEEKKIKLGEMIRRMTSEPANYFGLLDRGKVKEGFAADLVLFDSEKIKAKSTYAHPKRSSEGIQWVFINGKPAIQKGKWTGEKSGQPLKQMR